MTKRNDPSLVSLLQQEIDRLDANNPNPKISTSPLQSFIKKMSSKPNDFDDYCDTEMKQIKFEVITAKLNQPLSRGGTY